MRKERAWFYRDLTRKAESGFDMRTRETKWTVSICSPFRLYMCSETAEKGSKSHL